MNKIRLVTLLIVAGAIGAGLMLRHNGQEGHMQHGASGSGAPLAVVVVPQLAALEKVGETAFNENCASCHGVNAAGQDGVAPPLVHKIYEPSHHGDASFVLAAKQGVRQHHWSFGNMPPVDDISDEEIFAVIAYVRALQRANGIN